jgi:hypothetical protein
MSTQLNKSQWTYIGTIDESSVSVTKVEKGLDPNDRGSLSSLRIATHQLGTGSAGDDDLIGYVLADNIIESFSSQSESIQGFFQSQYSLAGEGELRASLMARRLFIEGGSFDGNEQYYTAEVKFSTGSLSAIRIKRKSQSGIIETLGEYFPAGPSVVDPVGIRFFVKELREEVYPHVDYDDIRLSVDVTYDGSYWENALDIVDGTGQMFEQAGNFGFFVSKGPGYTPDIGDSVFFDSISIGSDEVVLDETAPYITINWISNPEDVVTVQDGLNFHSYSDRADFLLGAVDPSTITLFEYSLDLAPPVSLTVPSEEVTFTGLGLGVHEIVVTAEDVATNSDTSSFSWFVEDFIDTQITSGPPATGSSTTATFNYSAILGSRALGSFQYRLDGGAWINNGTNTSIVLESLAIGDHTFEVKAIDDLGVEDQSPDFAAWTITAP